MSREGYCIRNPTRASQFSTISSYVSLKHLEQCAPFIIIYEPRTMCSKCNAPLPSRVCVYIVILYSTTCIGNFDLQQPWLTTRPICRTLTQVPRHTLVRSLPHSLSHSLSLASGIVLLSTIGRCTRGQQTNVKVLDVKCNLRHAQQLPEIAIESIIDEIFFHFSPRFRWRCTLYANCQNVLSIPEGARLIYAPRTEQFCTISKVLISQTGA